MCLFQVQTALHMLDLPIQLPSSPASQGTLTDLQGTTPTGQRHVNASECSMCFVHISCSKRHCCAAEFTQAGSADLMSSSLQYGSSTYGISGAAVAGCWLESGAMLLGAICWIAERHPLPPALGYLTPDTWRNWKERCMMLRDRDRGRLPLAPMTICCKTSWVSVNDC